ncbi:hypothetical protein RRG08_056415 [Elysia crispata]|uniref:Uncharacterized protein n=1 Tax=Elysia crispata TaxID=231223 RepID=A0AAE0Z5R7_9GAST|nr:hypothetical protein RRG08_056415 [Elysia crispata]
MAHTESPSARYPCGTEVLSILPSRLASSFLRLSTSLMLHHYLTTLFTGDTVDFCIITIMIEHLIYFTVFALAILAIVYFASVIHSTFASPTPSHPSASCLASAILYSVYHSATLQPL